jgi:hypothetical protein
VRGLSPARAAAQIREIPLEAWGAVTAAFYFFVEPDKAFVAIWVAFGLSIITKWLEISVQSGGLWPAIRDGKINKTHALR